MTNPPDPEAGQIDHDDRGPRESHRLVGSDAYYVADDPHEFGAVFGGRCGTCGKYSQDHPAYDEAADQKPSPELLAAQKLGYVALMRITRG